MTLRALSRTAAVLFGLALLVVAPARIAHGDNILASSNPADGASLGSSPTSLVLTFTDPLGPSNNVVASCNGSVFNIGLPAVSADRLSLTVAVVNPMPKGSCNVSATVSAPDASPNGSARFGFTITADPVAGVVTTPQATTGQAATVTTAVGATGTPGATAPSPESKAGGPLGLARLIASLGLAALLGSLVLIATAWPEGVEYILTVRFLRTSWGVATAGAMLTVVFATSQATGRSLGGSLSPTAWLDLKDAGAPGLALLLRAAFTTACFWTVIRPERCIDQSKQLPALALPVLAVATYGFSRSGGDLAAVGAVMGIGHALAMSIWLGGLLLLTRVVLAGPGDDDLVHAVRGFARISTPALLITVVTGAVQTFRLDRGTLFDTSHGQVLLLKAVVVGAMVFIGLATRQFIKTRVGNVDVMNEPLAARLRRATGIEALGGIAVLALSAWLMALVPGGLDGSRTADDGYAYTQGRIQVDDLDLTVSLTGVVGPNAVRITVAQPSTGLTNLVVTFLPPEGSGAMQVILTVPPELAGTGTAVLPIAEGVPLGAPGVWTIVVSATTSTGPKTKQRTLTVPVLG